MEIIRKIRIIVVLVFALFAISIFAIIPAYASSDSASYSYKKVDVNFNCLSENYAEVTVDLEVSMNNVMCWWINYSGSEKITASLESFQAGTSKDNLRLFLLSDNGSDFEKEGTPKEGYCAYDSKTKLLYINPATFNETGGGRYTGDVFIRYKTTLMHLKESPMWQDEIFSITAFKTNDSSAVPELNVTVENADRLNNCDIADQFCYAAGLFNLTSNFDLLSSDGKTFTYSGKMGKNISSNIFLSASEIPNSTRMQKLIIYVWGLWISLALFIFVVMTYVILYFVLGRRTPKDLEGIYFRDVPKTDDPINAVCRALTYRNPESRTLAAGEIIKEQDLITYVLLKNKDEGTARLIDDQTIEIDWNKLDDNDKKIYEKITLTKLCKIFDFKNDILTPDDRGVVTIKTDDMREIGSSLKHKVRCMEDDKLETFSDEMDNYETENLVNNYIDKDQIKTGKKLKLKTSKIGLYVWLAFLGYTIIAACLDMLTYEVKLLMAEAILLCLEIFFVARFWSETHEEYSKEEMVVVKQVIGLKNWILDFTSIKYQPPEADIVWGAFIRWSYLLGLSRKALKIAKEFADSDANDEIISELHSLSKIAGGSGSCLSIATSISTSVSSSVSSSVASASSSSGGGSGGGGGGGGGCR